MRCVPNWTALFPWLYLAVHTAGASSQPQLLTQFPPSVRIENLTILPNGTVVVCNALTGDLYTIDPPLSGPPRASPRLLASFAPHSSAVFGLATPSPSTIVATANNFSWDEARVEPGSNVVHHVTLTETGIYTRAFPIPSASWVNGLTPVPGSPHYLLIADCIAGSVLRLDTRTGAVRTVMTDPRFAPVPTPGVGLLLGINGVHARDGWLHFTNTNQGLYGRVAITREGLAAGTPAEVMATGRNGSTFDDFALRIGDGAAFLATASETVAGIEEITAVGERRMVASWDFGSPVTSQPVSAVFGPGAKGGRGGVLYFATAGAYLGSTSEPAGGQLFLLRVDP